MTAREIVFGILGLCLGVVLHFGIVLNSRTGETAQMAAARANLRLMETICPVVVAGLKQAQSEDVARAQGKMK